MPYKRLILLALVLVASAGVSTRAASPTEPMTLGQIVSLLEADVGESVILKQMTASRTRIILTVDALLKLKAAGASDTFMEEILDTAGPVDDGPAIQEITPEQVPFSYEEAPEGAPNFRVYTMVDPSGDEVIHITNLDESGTRIGGELPEPARSNVIASSQDPAPTYDYDYKAPPEEDAPVIVNVYPPAAPGGNYVEEQDPRFGRHQGELYPVGVYPGYYPYNPGFTPRVRTGYGRRGSYPNAYHYSPPGSYSHFINNHRPGGSHSFRRYYSANPYTRGTAHQRNQRQFNKLTPRPRTTPRR